MEDRNYYQRVTDIVDQSRDALPEQPRRLFRLPPGQRIKRLLLAALVVLLIVLAAAYVADSLVFRYRAAYNHTPYGSVTVDRFSAIHLKANRTEFSYQGSEAQTCANTIFPHASYPPCWYARRHTEKRVDF